MLPAIVFDSDNVWATPTFHQIYLLWLMRGKAYHWKGFELSFFEMVWFLDVLSGLFTALFIIIQDTNTHIAVFV